MPIFGYVKKYVVKAIIFVAKKNTFLSKKLSCIIINRICNKTPPRPRAFSLWSHLPKPKAIDQQALPGEYTTWPMLTDRLFSTRHLPPVEQSYINALPTDAPYQPGNPGQVTALFSREGDITEGRSSALFMFFAQWFTDSILRVDPTDRRKNTSNHHIDLCQIYGLTEETCLMLRETEGGKLRSQRINGEEYLEYLGEMDNNGNWGVKDHFKNMPYVKNGSIYIILNNWKGREENIYATGLERGNSSIGYVAISTLFMREHNRICKELAERNPGWDDERLFQTARIINTALLLKLTVTDYINHIAGDNIFKFDNSFAETQNWYRTPWISIEFDLLYRWHGLVPDKLKVGNTVYDHTQYRFNNKLLEDVGFSQVVNLASHCPAGKIALKNVPEFMLHAEYESIKMGRDFRLAPFNAYRKRFNLDPIESFEMLTDDEELRGQLEDLYGDIDKVEFFVGLFAEKHSSAALYGDLMYTMVAYDAFTQIYTNPLLSKNIFTAKTFTEFGMELIEMTNTVEDLANRNNQSKSPMTVKFGI